MQFRLIFSSNFYDYALQQSVAKTDCEQTAKLSFTAQFCSSVGLYWSVDSRIIKSEGCQNAPVE